MFEKKLSLLFCLVLSVLNTIFLLKLSRDRKVLAIAKETSHCPLVRGRGDTDITLIAKPTFRSNLTKSCPIYQDRNCRIYIFVKSACEYRFKRDIIRRTWGRVSYIDGCEFQTFFILGKASNKTLKSVQKEINNNSDILQFDGPDIYRNITTKTLTGMKWAVANLRKDDIYVTADDDMIIDVLKFREAVRNFHTMKADKQWPEFPIICGLSVMEGYVPHRTNTKWSISKEEYKWTSYPKFCLGGMYATNVEVVSQLVEVADVSKTIHLDDVWITGILRWKLGMPDSMLVGTKIPLSQHMIGFKDKTTQQANEFAMLKWNTYSDALTDKVTCLST